MFRQRHRVIARWAKSRQTPWRSLKASQAVLVDLGNEVADRLHPAPAQRGVRELVPGELGHPVGFAIAAPQEEDQRLLWQLRDGVLNGRRNDRLPLAAVVDGRVGGHAKMPRGGDQTRAPISKPISVGG